MLKEFTIDWDNTTDIKKHISILQKRRKLLLVNTSSYTPIHFGVSKHNLHDLMHIFEFLMCQTPFNEADESGLYYTYVHCDPTQKLNPTKDVRDYLLITKYGLTHKPIYVGKGTGTRCFNLNRNEGHRKIRTYIKSKDKELIVVKVKENLSEQLALFEEQKLILFLGLSVVNQSGMLVNLQTDNKIVDFFRKSLKEFKPTTEHKNLFEVKMSDDKFKQRLKNKASTLIRYLSKWI